MKNKSHDEWYTPKHIIDLARDILGEIDLDPCSSKGSQPIIQAKTNYCIEDDGFNRKWNGRIFLNPPYCKNKEIYGDNYPATYHWLWKAQKAQELGEVSEIIALVNRTDGDWYNEILDHMDAYYQCRKRIKFIDGKGGKQSSPRYNNDLLYLGGKPEIFWESCISHLGNPAIASFYC